MRWTPERIFLVVVIMGEDREQVDRHMRDVTRLGMLAPFIATVPAGRGPRVAVARVNAAGAKQEQEAQGSESISHGMLGDALGMTRMSTAERKQEC